MKKGLIALLMLLTVAALTACSKGNEEAGSASSSAAKESVSTSSRSSSSTSGSSSSSSQSQDLSEPLVSDEEISQAITVGDYKALFARLQERIATQLQVLRDRYPAEAEALQETIGPFGQLIEEQKQNFDRLISSFGDDSSSVPDQARASLISLLQSVRDLAQNTLRQLEVRFGQGES